jgi:protein-disulfide isomerase
MTTRQQGTLRPDVSERDHVLGPEAAPITLVEYGDLQCPHCRRAHGVLPRVLRRMGDRARLVFRHFPLTESHPNALRAAEAAESVAAQAGEKGFWQMHDLLYDHQPEWEEATDVKRMLELARQAGADSDTVAADLDADRYEEQVKEDFMSGVRSGVNGTPTFFINGQRFEGDWTNVDTFVAALESVAP